MAAGRTYVCFRIRGSGPGKRECASWVSEESPKSKVGFWETRRGDTFQGDFIWGEGRTVMFDGGLTFDLEVRGHGLRRGRGVVALEKGGVRRAKKTQEREQRS